MTNIHPEIASIEPEVENREWRLFERKCPIDPEVANMEPEAKSFLLEQMSVDEEMINIEMESTNRK